MAGKCEVAIRVVSMGGLATCDVCSTLVSWFYPWAQLEGVAAMRCPCCGGSCEVHLECTVAALEADPVRWLG